MIFLLNETKLFVARCFQEFQELDFLSPTSDFIVPYRDNIIEQLYRHEHDSYNDNSMVIDQNYNTTAW